MGNLLSFARLPAAPDLLMDLAGRGREKEWQGGSVGAGMGT